METVNKNSGDNIIKNDWNAAKSFYSCKNGICTSCLLKHKEKQHLLLSISKLTDSDFKIDLGNFLKSLSKFKRPVLFYHQDTEIKGQVLIKFTGNEHYEGAFKTVTPFLPDSKTPATIISPFALSKGNRLNEQNLVKLTLRYFEPLGFIKLHLHSVADFHEYAKNENIGLLVMPLKDLPDYVQYVMSHENPKLVIPAVFQE